MNDSNLTSELKREAADICGNLKFKDSWMHRIVIINERASFVWSDWQPSVIICIKTNFHSRSVIDQLKFALKNSFKFKLSQKIFPQEECCHCHPKSETLRLAKNLKIWTHRSISPIRISKANEKKYFPGEKGGQCHPQ